MSVVSFVLGQLLVGLNLPNCIHVVRLGSGKICYCDIKVRLLSSMSSNVAAAPTHGFLNASVCCSPLHDRQQDPSIT